MIDNHCYGYILMEENESPPGVCYVPNVDEDLFIYVDARKAAAILIRNFRHHRKFLREYYPNQDNVYDKLVFELRVPRDAPWKASFLIYNAHESVRGYIKCKDIIL